MTVPTTLVAMVASSLVSSGEIYLDCGVSSISPCTVSMTELIVNPGAFHSKWVRFLAVVRFDGDSSIGFAAANELAARYLDSANTIKVALPIDSLCTVDDEPLVVQGQFFFTGHQYQYGRRLADAVLSRPLTGEQICAKG